MTRKCNLLYSLIALNCLQYLTYILWFLRTHIRVPTINIIILIFMTMVIIPDNLDNLVTDHIS